MLQLFTFLLNLAYPDVFFLYSTSSHIFKKNQKNPYTYTKLGAESHRAGLCKEKWFWGFGVFLSYHLCFLSNKLSFGVGVGWQQRFWSGLNVSWKWVYFIKGEESLRGKEREPRTSLCHSMSHISSVSRWLASSSLALHSLFDLEMEICLDSLIKALQSCIQGLICFFSDPSSADSS